MVKCRRVSIILFVADDTGHKHSSLEADWKEDVTLTEIIEHYEDAIEKVDV